MTLCQTDGVIRSILTAGGSQEASEEQASCGPASRAFTQKSSAQPSAQVEDQQQTHSAPQRDAKSGVDDTAASI